MKRPFTRIASVCSVALITLLWLSACDTYANEVPKRGGHLLDVYEVVGKDDYFDARKILYATWEGEASSWDDIKQPKNPNDIALHLITRDGRKWKSIWVIDKP